MGCDHSSGCITFISYDTWKIIGFQTEKLSTPSVYIVDTMASNQEYCTISKLWLCLLSVLDILPVGITLDVLPWMYYQWVLP